MGLFVSTTGASQTIPELGITIVHPTTDLDVLAQFSPEEVQSAATLTSLIQAGTLVWRKVAAGAIQTAANYDPDFTELERMNTGPGATADRGVTFKDLTAAAIGISTKAGRVAAGSFTGNPKKATVTFATAFASANYSTNITGGDARSWTIESKVAGSFVINSNANAALTLETGWQAQLDGEVG